jgi:hypothetical protein
MPVLSTDQLWERFERNELTHDELDRAFRELSKQTHPDLAGGDGAPFIALRETYLELKGRLLEQERSREGAAAQSSPHGPEPRSGPGARPGPDQGVDAGGPAETGFQERRHSEGQDVADPLRVIRECGYPETVDVRTAFHIALNRYFSMGLYSFRVRNNGSTRRHQLVRETVLYWAERYDPRFLDFFTGYDQIHHIRVTDMTYRDHIHARRAFLQVVDWFFKFQDHGRASARDICRERAGWARAVLNRFRNDAQSQIMRQFLEWLMREIELPPVRLRHIW